MTWRPVPLVLLLTVACATYQPAPLDTATAPARFRARGAPAADARGRTTAETLALAARRTRPELEVARAGAVEARAAIGAARTRPQPGLNVAVERRIGGVEQGDSPWFAALEPVLLLELGGKRGARVAEAAARLATAEVAVHGLAWQVTAEVRRHALLAAQRSAVLAADSSLVRARGSALALAEAQQAAGAIGATEVARQRELLAAAEAEQAADALVLADALTALRRAAALRDPLPLVPDVAPAAGCAWLARAGLDSVEATALRRRPEVARAVTAYAAADALVRLRVAEAAPDLAIGPGLIFDQGTQRWALNAGLPTLRLDRNRGAVTEAMAARERAGAEVRAAQEAVLADVADARADCVVAAAAAARAETLRARADDVRAAAEAAWTRGELGARERAEVLAGAARAARDAQRARAEADVAELAVEEAAGIWLGARVAAWPDPLSTEGAGDPGARESR